MSQNERKDRYTFGDNDLAGFRLRLLAEAYGPSSRAWIAERAGALRDARVVALDLSGRPSRRHSRDKEAPSVGRLA